MIYRRVQRDPNHIPISNELKKMGFGVIDLSMVGGGVPDSLISNEIEMYLVEFKTPELIKNRKKTDGLSPKQVEWWDNWRGKPVINAVTIEDVLRAFKK